MDMLEGQTHLSQWGNSEATRIPKQVVKKLGLKVNQKLKIKIKNGSIVLTPEKKKPTNIHELFAGWKDDGKRDHELDWGKAQGNELPW